MAAISIITPSYNQGRFIERTIQSVLNQDTGGHALEYFVVDGGSQDETLEVVRRYAARLRWLSEADRGQANAVNKGLHATGGELIGWLNSDDVYYSGAIRAACDFLEAHPGVDVVYGDAEYIDESGTSLGRYPSEPFALRRLEEICYLCQPAVFFRRRLVERFGGLDERLHIALDYEYWLRLALGGATFSYLPRLFAGWRLYPGIKSYARRLEMHAEVNRVMLERVGYVPDQWIYNYAHARLELTGIDSTKHMRFAVSLAALTALASLRWNRSLPPTVRTSMRIWLKDGLKQLYWSLRAHARALLVR